MSVNSASVQQIVLSSTGPLGHWSMVVSTVHSRLPHVLSLVEAAVWQTVVLTTVLFLVQSDVTQVVDNNSEGPPAPRQGNLSSS